ncbi:Site-specific DNA-methyltransferase (adenine-specific) [Methanocorpusculum labreanum Z]|uniref:Site-specific DNA-methyltransferase (Adenine-specific) n=1 Tax=Methanocorpusculum labreanum (strain ATCC 43576 / DSM 4855 / Z) TaxID=410358 RepID=A2SSR4_METLZ|nr:site-specific DNA-methyltransferase [Methanocorpusculum labreanum]ABN07370.1 Site-specific DNA-methyltransferase (adenine-specific) [Methanocorpusculum labreanum Z]
MEQHNPAFQKIPLATTNPFSENLRRLQALFPSIVKDGQIDFDALKEELGEVEEVDKEHYELSWAGKQEAKRTAGEPILGRTLKYVPEESKNPDSTENLYIEGDNLEVLKLLQNSYVGKIKMIYIDPPYNTGNDFVYKDHFAVSAEENAKAEGDISAEGERYAVNPKTSGKYHANWLSMMYPRLRLAKNLLREDGIMFISIDDNEVGNLREICDEIFGDNNFLANLIWEKKYTRSNDATFFSDNHDHILCYCRNVECFKIGRLPRTEEMDVAYKNPDNHPKGLWKATPLHAKSGSANSANFTYTFKNGVVFTPPTGTYSRYSSDTLKKYDDNNEIWFGQDGMSIPARKTFLCDLKNEGIVPSTIIPYKTGGHNHESVEELKDIFIKNIFTNPKPTRLIRHLATIANLNHESLILDFFSGSSTTAHAVMQLNAEDGGTRKFIMVQLPEACDEKSEAYKAGYKTICDIGKERIRRAGDKIQKEHPEASLDTGFNVFRLADTNIRWIAAETGQVSLEDAIITSGKDLRDFMPGYTDKDVVYEILLRQYDIPLTAKIESLGKIGKRTYSVAGTLIVCLEENITNEIIDKIAGIEPVPHKIIFRDSAFGDDISLKENTMMRLDALMQKHSSGGKTPYRVEFL